ncbi:unnamed protein product [Hapterophycus canaliculatus]
MLNERQAQAVVEKVNLDVDVPLATEGMERSFIEKLVNKVVPQMELSLQAFMPEAYVELIKVGLNESLSAAERKEAMSELLRGQLSDPLSKQLNERVDCSFIPEPIEGKVLKIVANKLVDEFVESAVQGGDGEPK